MNEAQLVMAALVVEQGLWSAFYRTYLASFVLNLPQRK
jgi:hypothetical protein